VPFVDPRPLVFPSVAACGQRVDRPWLKPESIRTDVRSVNRAVSEQVRWPFVGVLVLALLGVGVLVVHRDRHHRHDAAELASYQRAVGTMNDLPLPAGVIDGGNRFCATAAGIVCAHSNQSPNALTKPVAQLLNAVVPTDGSPIFGSLDHYPAYAIIVGRYQHVTGTPPRRGIVVGPASRHNYLVGSYVTIELDQPTT
jgi:hypothetical protein